MLANVCQVTVVNVARIATHARPTRARMAANALIKMEITHVNACQALVDNDARTATHARPTRARMAANA